MESNYNAANYCHRSIYHLVQANSGLHIKPILFEVFRNKSIFDGDRYRSSSSACEWVACIAAIAVSAWGHHCAPVLHGWPSPTVSWQDTTTIESGNQSINQNRHMSPTHKRIRGATTCRKRKLYIVLPKVTKFWH